MIKVTLIYTADQDGNFTNPETGTYWDIPEDRSIFRATIEGRCVLCDRHMFERNWRSFQDARKIVVITNKEFYFQTGIGLEIASRLQRDYGLTDLTSHKMPMAALIYLSVNLKRNGTVYCVGEKKIIEACAPFASRVLATDICRAPASPADYTDCPLWVPKHISVELPDILSEDGAWKSLAFDLEKHENLNWRFSELQRARPIEL